MKSSVINEGPIMALYLYIAVQVVELVSFDCQSTYNPFYGDLARKGGRNGYPGPAVILQGQSGSTKGQVLPRTVSICAYFRNDTIELI
jgi:hypothetical protein